MKFRMAHRGGMAYEPENTMLAFRNAIKMRANYIELDVHLSKDGHVVVMHDETLDRTTNGHGRISDLTLKQIKRFRTKEKDQPVPTLDEVFKKLKGKIKFNIEIKGVRPALAVAEMIKKHKLEKDVIVSCNFPKSLMTMKQQLPKVRTALLFYAAKNAREQIFIGSFSELFLPIAQQAIIYIARISKVDYVHLMYPVATKRFIKKLQNKGYKVNVWVVNTPMLIKKLKKIGVDGIISDRPDRL